VLAVDEDDGVAGLEWGPLESFMPTGWLDGEDIVISFL
jgi:hypothetical protein